MYKMYITAEVSVIMNVSKSDKLINTVVDSQSI